MIRGPKSTTVHLTIVPFGKPDSHARVVGFMRDEMKAQAR
jgi:hypothetical protein